MRLFLRRRGERYGRTGIHLCRRRNLLRPAQKAFGLRRPRIDRLLVALLRPRGNHRVYLGFEPGDFVVAQLYRRGKLADLYQSSHMIATVGDPLLGTEKGISHCRDHVRRLVKVGKFPAPIQLSDHKIAWLEAEIDAMIAARAEERNKKPINSRPPEPKRLLSRPQKISS